MANQNKQYDIVLKNGRVIDPETYFDRVCNVGITDGKVVTISEDPLSGKEEKDVTGMIVSPGFIDLHAHTQNIALTLAAGLVIGVTLLKPTKKV